MNAIIIYGSHHHGNTRKVVEAIVDEKGNLELRDKSNTKKGNTKFRLYNYGNGDYEFQLEDGRYIGIETTQIKMGQDPSIVNGLRLKAVKKDETKNMTLWNIYSENNYDIFSIRPRMIKDYVVNASGQKNKDGTEIILYYHSDSWVCTSYPYPDAPKHADIKFIPVLPAVYKVRKYKTPYRDKPDGKILGELDWDFKVWVTEIKDHWAKVKFNGKTYYMWATKLESVEPDILAPIVIKGYPSKYTYKVGEKLTLDGLEIVDMTGGKEKPINTKDLSFTLTDYITYKDGTYAENKTVKIKSDYKFKKKMEAIVAIYYKGINITSHSVFIE